MNKLSPHQKIMRAAKRMTGLRLTEEEVFQLSIDDAIKTRADVDDEQRGEREYLPECETCQSTGKGLLIKKHRSLSR